MLIQHDMALDVSRNYHERQHVVDAPLDQVYGRQLVADGTQLQVYVLQHLGDEQRKVVYARQCLVYEQPMVGDGRLLDVDGRQYLAYGHRRDAFCVLSSYACLLPGDDKESFSAEEQLLHSIVSEM